MSNSTSTAKMLSGSNLSLHLIKLRLEPIIFYFGDLQLDGEVKELFTSLYEFLHKSTLK